MDRATEDRLVSLGFFLACGFALAAVLGGVALPPRWARRLAWLAVPGLPGLLLFYRANDIGAAVGARGLSEFVLYVGVGVFLALPHLLRFWGREPIWLSLGLGQSTMVVLITATEIVDGLGPFLLLTHETEIDASLNLWSVLYYGRLVMGYGLAFTTPFALVAALALAWWRRLGRI